MGIQVKMRILLSYSRLHFNPGKSPENHKYWGSSASILARSLYKTLAKIGKVTYIDSSEYEKVKGIEFDLFVGITNNFYKIWQSAKIKKSIYFAVNMHPRERNWILLNYLIKERLSPKALAGWDLVNFFEAEKGINKADYILCMGNIAVYNSYIKNGVPKSKIKMLNYGIDSISGDKSRSTLLKKEKRYVYITSEIGLRKGFDIVYSLFTNPKILEQEFHLDIIGLPTNNYYKNKLEKFKQILKDKVKYYGWIDSNSRRYWEIIKSNDFVILPSLEEGQAGTVLEAVSYGVIPIISANSGIDFAPLNTLELKINSRSNKEIILKSLNLKENEISNLKNKTLEYYSEYHSNFKETLDNSIKDCIRGELYPKVSVVLPIYNKERTIKSLVSLLHGVCLEYKNVEVHIIFDGCTDKSEKIVRDFYRNVKSYRVTYEITPNLFEVKTNNAGLKKSSGKYCVIVQDDNYIFDKNIFFEAISFLDRSSKAVILGGLAGVNYYPRETKNLVGKGQIVMNKKEVYWRQDEKTDSDLKNKIFEVDACMRGPLFFRKSFLDEYGYLDEVYAPLHHDDMDICFRARHIGYKVYCMLFDVLNTSLTVAKYNEEKWKYWMKIYNRNCDILYSRWHPTRVKNYLWLHRTKILTTPLEKLLATTKKVFIQKMNRDYSMRSALAYVRRLF